MSNPENTLIATQQDAATEKDEGVYVMYDELVAAIALHKKRPPANVQDVTFLLLREIFPIIRDLAFYAKNAREDIDFLLENLDDEHATLGTQFTREDAVKFDHVLQLAQGTAKEILNQPNLEPEKRVIFEKMASLAEECLKIVEETTLVEEEESEPGPSGEGEEEPEAT